jgi:hypothetical protein
MGSKDERDASVAGKWRGVSALGGAHQRAAEQTKAQLSAAVRSMNTDHWCVLGLVEHVELRGMLGEAPAKYLTREIGWPSGRGLGLNVGGLSQTQEQALQVFSAREKRLSFMGLWQRGQSRSMSKLRLRSSAQGRHRLRRGLSLGFSSRSAPSAGCSVWVCCPASVPAGGWGITSGRHFAAGAKTPAYRAVLNRGACTAAAKRHKRERGSRSRAKVPSENARLRVMRHRPLSSVCRRDCASAGRST